MTRDTKPNHGFKGNAKGSTGVVFPSPLIKKAARDGTITITEQGT